MAYSNCQNQKNLLKKVDSKITRTIIVYLRLVGLSPFIFQIEGLGIMSSPGNGRRLFFELINFFIDSLNNFLHSNYYIIDITKVNRSFSSLWNEAKDDYNQSKKQMSILTLTRFFLNFISQPL